MATRLAPRRSAISRSISISTTRCLTIPNATWFPRRSPGSCPTSLSFRLIMSRQKTLAEFLTWAKQKGRVSYGSPGVGTSPHLSGVMFAKQTGIDAIHVPFRGAAQTIPAMLAGDVNFAIDNLASYVPVIQSGKMRALAVTSAQRWPTLPDVPTMSEAGIKDFVVTSWAAFVFPAATPRPIVDRFSAAQRQIAGEQAIQERFLVAGARVLSSTPEGAIAFAAKERTMWKDVVAASGAKVD